MKKQEIYIILGIGGLLLLVLLRLLWKDTMYTAAMLPHAIEHDGRKYGYSELYFTDVPGNYSDTPRGEGNRFKSKEPLISYGPGGSR